MPFPPGSRRRFLQQVVAVAAAAPLSDRMLAAHAPVPAERAASGDAPLLVVLWFDTEDYILTEDDDATLRLATMLTRLGVKATFKIVGEKARVLEQRGRHDVIAALRQHEIGYHSNTHSQQPTVAVYLQHAGWDEGIAEFLRRERAGAQDVARVIGVPPLVYGQPGSSWAPQTYPALREMGIRLYLDEADHVGIDDQPFYYGGLLNVFKMRSNVTRMPLEGGSSLQNGKDDFTKVSAALRAKGGGTISIYYHPNEWVQTEFWDAVNFSKGANPPRSEWRRPGTRPPSETESAFRDFEQYIRFVGEQPGVRFVTPRDLFELYADRAGQTVIRPATLGDVARTYRDEAGFVVRDGWALSAAEAFSVLAGAAAAYVQDGAWPEAVRPAFLDGPGRPHVRAEGQTPAPATIPWEAYARAVRDTAGALELMKRVPDEIWIGVESLSPADFLATTAGVIDAILSNGGPPAEVTRRTGRMTAERYVAADTPSLWGWPIFPEGFHAPWLMELARLQAWTLKPAILEA